MTRNAMMALGLVVLSTAGCRDMGLDGNTPAEEAAGRQGSALMLAITAPTESDGLRLIVDGRLWIPSGRPETLRPTDLRSIGSADGQTVYARSWDASPYDALFVRDQQPAAEASITPDAQRWARLLPVRGRSGPLPAPAADGAAEQH